MTNQPKEKRSTDNCYLTYTDELEGGGHLTCTYNHKVGEECLMDSKEYYMDYQPKGGCPHCGFVPEEFNATGTHYCKPKEGWEEAIYSLAEIDEQSHRNLISIEPSLLISIIKSKVVPQTEQRVAREIYEKQGKLLEQLFIFLIQTLDLRTGEPNQQKSDAECIREIVKHHYNITE